jgi:putative hemolysin
MNWTIILLIIVVACTIGTGYRVISSMNVVMEKANNNQTYCVEIGGRWDNTSDKPCFIVTQMLAIGEVNGNKK